MDGPKMLRGHRASVHSLSFATSEVGDLLFSSDDSGRILVWNLEDLRPHVTLKAGCDAVMFVGAVNRHLVSQSRFGNLCLWDWEVNTNHPVTSNSSNSSSFCKAAIYGRSQDTFSVVAPTSDNTNLGIWDPRSNVFNECFRLREQTPKIGMCTSLCSTEHVGPNYLLAAYEDGSLLLWDTRFSHPCCNFRVHGQPVFGITVCQPSSSSSCLTCVSGSADGQVIQSRISLGDPTAAFCQQDGTRADVSHVLDWVASQAPALASDASCGVGSMASNGDSSAVSAGCWDGHIRIYDSLCGRLISCLRGHKGPVHAVQFSPCNSLFASAGQDANVALWIPVSLS